MDLIFYDGAYNGVKVDQAISRALSGGALDQRIDALQAAVGSPLTAATVADMTNINKVYVYTGTEAGYTAGHWYYWNGAAWTDGGVYNAVAVDSALSPTSVNPVENKAVYNALHAVQLDVDALEAFKTYIALREEEDRQILLGSVADVAEDSYSELRSAPIHTAITIGQSVYPRMDNTRLGLNAIKGRTVVDNDALVPCIVSGWSVTGFNLWDEEIRTDGYYKNDGTWQNASNVISAKNPIPVMPNTDYCVTYAGAKTGVNIAVTYWDANQNFLFRASNVSMLTTPANCFFILFNLNTQYGTTYDHDVCINLSKTTGSPQNGDYLPYQHTALSFTSTRLDGVGTAQDVLECVEVAENDYKLVKTTKMGSVDLGSLTWTALTDANTFYADISDIAPYPMQFNMICSKYPVVGRTVLADNDKSIAKGNNNQVAIKRVFVHDSAYSDAATFTTAMNGVYLVYELATPATETTIAEHLTLAEVSLLAENGGIVSIVNSNGDIVQPDLTASTVISRSAS